MGDLQQGNYVGKRNHSVSRCTCGTESNSFCCHHSTMECFSLSRRHMGEDMAAVTPNCFPGAVFSECPFKEGYDLSIGTSERGSSVDQVTLPSFRFVSCLLGPT